MEIRHILGAYPCQYDGDLTLAITGLTNDSRKVQKGSLFFCIEGYESDGHDYAPAAVEAGAAALVVKHKLPLPVPQVVVADDREAMAVLSANYYGNPAKKLKMVGITGTNGKTTVTYICGQIARHAGAKVGIIGTICNWVGEKRLETKNTTPESVELQRILSEMVAAGVEVVFMEVSSHSLYLKRVAGITFDVGVFTNLTQDHLDFHGTLQNYMKAKGILFQQSKLSVINIDDISSQYMMGKAAGEVVTYGTREMADYKAKDVESYAWGSKFTISSKGKAERYTFHVPGMFNVLNALCGAVVCKRLGYDDQDVREGVAAVTGVDGRCQVLKAEPYTIVLDYAHTPDGLENILKTFQGLGRLVTVFGCGGNRDAKKRPMMGKIAGQHSDFVVLTSDNPRFEEPMDIIKQIEPGLKETGCPFVVMEDRRAAIAYAIDHAAKGDIIILAGKGHETYQEIRGVRHDFDEKVVVRGLLQARKEENQ